MSGPDSHRRADRRKLLDELQQRPREGFGRHDVAVLQSVERRCPAAC